MPIIVDYAGLGKRIRKNRKLLHLTQEELADLAGISLSFMGHIERGSRKASIETLVNIAAALNVSIDWLMLDSYCVDAMVIDRTDREHIVKLLTQIQAMLCPTSR